MGKAARFLQHRWNPQHRIHIPKYVYGRGLQLTSIHILVSENLRRPGFTRRPPALGLRRTSSSSFRIGSNAMRIIYFEVDPHPCRCHCTSNANCLQLSGTPLPPLLGTVHQKATQGSRGKIRQVCVFFRIRLQRSYRKCS